MLHVPWSTFLRGSMLPETDRATITRLLLDCEWTPAGPADQDLFIDRNDPQRRRPGGFSASAKAATEPQGAHKLCGPTTTDTYSRQSEGVGLCTLSLSLALASPHSLSLSRLPDSWQRDCYALYPLDR